MEIKFENESRTIEKGKKIYDLLDCDQKKSTYAYTCNGKLCALTKPLEEGNIELITKDSNVGKQIYDRSLNFLFIAAVHRLYPKAHVHVEHALGNGVFCEIEEVNFLTPKDVETIENEMKKMVLEGIDIKHIQVKTEEAVAYFFENGMENKANLLKNRKKAMSSIYELDGVKDYFYGIMLPNTSYLTSFKLRYYAPGVLVSSQDKFVNQTKLFEVFQAFEEWGNLIGVSNISQLNQKIIDGKMDELVLMSETMAEKQLEDIASNIVHEHSNTKFIMIAGPSSAGKTTFSKRLAIHLRIHGKEPITISMDDFYINRENCKILPDGNYDFDSIDAIDLTLFNETLLKLLSGEEVRMPRYNFKKGKREWKDQSLKMNQNQILIIEGIHGLNPASSMYIPEKVKYRIYINALTHLNLDDHNRFPTSDYRLLRRITRDNQFRGWTAADTIKFWGNVRDAEDRFIYPYQEEANAIFNSSMIYELAVLKPLVKPLLEKITPDKKEYLEANRLCKLLDYIVEGTTEAIPRTSILSEFIGNSIFEL